jgi:phosphatidylethanolamine/phosphatidyl-N-methylethanolamine N-methyltransferase
MERRRSLTNDHGERSWLGRFLAAPRQIGAIAPSSRVLARAMIAAVPPPGERAILELGPGGGVFTDALISSGIAPSQIVAIEFDKGMAAALHRRFPGVRVVNGDAFDRASVLAQAPEGYAAAISGLPLLNFPKAQGAALIRGLLDAMPAGAPFVQFSYGLAPPVPPANDLTVHRAAMVWRNLPPARVWVYRRP